jgi:hypothetical protein
LEAADVKQTNAVDVVHPRVHVVVATAVLVAVYVVVGSMPVC